MYVLSGALGSSNIRGVHYNSESDKEQYPTKNSGKIVMFNRNFKHFCMKMQSKFCYHFIFATYEEMATFDYSSIDPHEPDITKYKNTLEYVEYSHVILLVTDSGLFH